MRTISLLLLWGCIVGACCFAQHLFCCGAKNPTASVEKTASTGFLTSGQPKENNRASYSIFGEKSWSIKCLEGDFKKSNSELLTDVENRQDCFTKLSNYQQNHKNQTWLITGDYTSSEKNNTIYRNLGEARAQKIKQVLVNQHGFTPALLSIKGRLVDEVGIVNDTLFNAYRITRSSTITEKHNSGKSENTVATAYRFNQVKPIILYFDLDSNNPNMNSVIRNRFANLIYDLEHHQNMNIHVIGHTDKKGDANYNLQLGKERATSVRDYLIQNGIPSSRIQISSEGERRPISSIDSENRRAEVTIIKN